MMREHIFFQRIKIIGLIFILIGAIILVWALIKKPSDVEEVETIYWLIIITVGSGIFLSVYAMRRHKTIWNDLPLEIKAEILAAELKSGKREWCLNQFGDNKYFFAPLKKYKLNEFGGGRHLESSRAQIELFARAGKIENIEMTKLILAHFVSK